jgi:hypothetical protein
MTSLRQIEVMLWRQVNQILVAVDTLDRRKPLEQKQPLFFSFSPTGLTASQSAPI